MTEAEWPTATNPEALLELVRGRARARKLRLFAIACCQRAWHELHLEPSDPPGEPAENFAGAVATAIGPLAVPGRERSEVLSRSPEFEPVSSPPGAINAAAVPLVLSVFGTPDLIREIFGNPFRPVTFSPSWCTETAVTLARQMYESRDFSPMPILADALQDAGCDSADVLDHCRGPGPHVRGCWVVDLVLGKE